MARHGTRLLSREGETGDQSCVVPNIVHSPVPSTLSRPSMRGSFYSLSVASLADALWKLRLTRGRRPGGASATARAIWAWRARRLRHLRPVDFTVHLGLLHVCKHTPTKMDGTLNFARAPSCRSWAGERATVPQSGAWLCLSRSAPSRLILCTLACTPP